MKKDGGLAYPNQYGAEGMSLRDYFAAATLSALLGKQALEVTDKGESAIVIQNARWAYAYADAMLAEREKE